MPPKVGDKKKKQVWSGVHSMMKRMSIRWCKAPEHLDGSPVKDKPAPTVNLSECESKTEQEEESEPDPNSHLRKLRLEDIRPPPLVAPHLYRWKNAPPDYLTSMDPPYVNSIRKEKWLSEINTPPPLNQTLKPTTKQTKALAPVKSMNKSKEKAAAKENKEIAPKPQLPGSTSHDPPSSDDEQQNHHENQQPLKTKTKNLKMKRSIKTMKALAASKKLPITDLTIREQPNENTQPDLQIQKSTAPSDNQPQQLDDSITKKIWTACDRSVHRSYLCSYRIT